MENRVIYIASADAGWLNMVAAGMASIFEEIQFTTVNDVQGLWHLPSSALVIYDKASLGNPTALLINPRERGGKWLIVNADSLDEESVPGLISLGFSGLIVKNQTLERMPRAIRTLTANELWFSRHAMSLSLKQNFNLSSQPTNAIHVLSAKYNLSVREQQVFLCLVQGQANKDIALAMNLSPSTIKCHVAVILQKTGKQGRSQVSALLLEDALECVI
ncbi:LuxR C-terminal-related transcriptional regulator [Shewanella sp. SNU WT4]|uniref:helix-turn-helix transcriptional regulator n=1 Tax=Shewanella sp. SNU WT4 TaxID=2590015 RepID=UPI001F10AC34|nr:LuxR C-terminal-related transcriptional regulator [Shewanella sp. SNU WT4]